MWLEYGGSGLNMSFVDVNELDHADIVSLIEQMREQKKREAASIKAASRKR